MSTSRGTRRILRWIQVCTVFDFILSPNKTMYQGIRLRRVTLFASNGCQTHPPYFGHTAVRCATQDQRPLYAEPTRSVRNLFIPHFMSVRILP